MAVIRDDPDEVARIVNRFPDSLFEVDIFGQTPLHLATEKPEVLSLLGQVADDNTLNRLDRFGDRSAIDLAMMRSGDRCIYGGSNQRCRNCGCTDCVNILLEAGCGLRARNLGYAHNEISLSDILSPASELARRRYIFEMQRARQVSPQSAVSNSQNGRVTSSSDSDGSRGNYDEAEQCGWVYNEICDTGLANLFYRNGFRPSPNIFLHLVPRLRNARLQDKLDLAYICWLVEHGADLFSKFLAGTSTREDGSENYISIAHYAFFMVGASLRRRPFPPKLDDLTSFKKLSTTLTHHDLADGCKCYCSTEGCTPFLWMMKAWNLIRPKRVVSDMEEYYRICGGELTVLTYEAAIRFLTFQALGLTHTCCNAEALVRDYGWTPRVEEDQMTTINDEQAHLLELHETLVTELTEVAREYLETETFSDFWRSIWMGRIEEVLEKLDGCNLSDAEIRGAEEIGVRWCSPPPIEEVDGRNPYAGGSIEWYFFELDQICLD